MIRTHRSAPNGQIRWQMTEVPSLEAVLYTAGSADDAAVETVLSMADRAVREQRRADSSGSQAAIYFNGDTAAKVHYPQSPAVDYDARDVFMNAALHYGLAQLPDNYFPAGFRLVAPQIHAVAVPYPGSRRSDLTFVMDRLTGYHPDDVEHQQIGLAEIKTSIVTALGLYGYQANQMDADICPKNTLLEDADPTVIRQAGVFDVRFVG